ncbi:hypothetical protein [Mycobacterium sp. Marseille-P9652]|uniref:hypothetical protein n=1 Tax=Mycobacterium sp. Marseille-P9652 TaxID=2654950 RepID=UPI0018D0B6C9|nr:hypothetical protein [Mycobacterium sp. Marseille-P9652]
MSIPLGGLPIPAPAPAPLAPPAEVPVLVQPGAAPPQAPAIAGVIPQPAPAGAPLAPPAAVTPGAGR